jgi:hypothetical protein
MRSDGLEKYVGLQFSKQWRGRALVMWSAGGGKVDPRWLSRGSIDEARRSGKAGCGEVRRPVLRLGSESEGRRIPDLDT